MIPEDDNGVIRIRKKDLEVLLGFAYKWAEVDSYDNEVLQDTVRSIAVT